MRDRIDRYADRWRHTQGAERANYQLFLTELCTLLDLPQPLPQSRGDSDRNYCFEFAVKQSRLLAPASLLRIDLYRRGCFVLEAKQSLLKDRGTPGVEISLSKRGRRGSGGGWDVQGLNAQRQAENYAKCLPADHGWPPFLIVCDVGHCLDIYADFSGLGKNYVQFPDRGRFRIFLDALHDPEIRDRLNAIWTDPMSLDPARRAAKLSREIAGRLAQVSRRLEQDYDAEDVPLFLMRCLFTMFAEDVELIPRDTFKTLLRRSLDKPRFFRHAIGELWSRMDTGGYCVSIESEVKRFNGSMFKDAVAFELDRTSIAEILAAAECDWREIDTAIFGTLLEQALDPKERAKLGAHYTPRAYVERLVIETVIAPLREDWRIALAAAQREHKAGRRKKALVAIEEFHKKLCTARVLDPACGTGNFLHVAQDLMQRLEGEVLEARAELGGTEHLGGFSERDVGPAQFFGIDANKRAVAITQLMLWIGYLQWHLRARPYAPREPILRSFATIRWGDALMTWPEWPDVETNGHQELRKRREVIPAGALRSPWPEAEFIVGNPPFIGGKDIRKRLGDGYAEGLWALYPEMNRSADLVMYWWSRAADILTAEGSKLRRFGFVTTNSITQPFQRRVVARHLDGDRPVWIVLAIPDHPWTKVERSSAAVRIAMTVVEVGAGKPGKLMRVASDAALDTDQPEVVLIEEVGVIDSHLRIGGVLAASSSLRANAGLSSRGVMLFGEGFLVEKRKAIDLGRLRREGLKRHIRPYRNGKDLTGQSRDLMVIDLFGLAAEEARQRFPEVYQHLKLNVKESRDDKGRPNGRDVNNRASYRDRWWLFGEPRKELRPALAGLPRYIATVETAKHRVFQFLPAEIVPDNMLVAIALSDGFYLGVLSSRFHVFWALRQGGTLEDRPRYSKSLCFDPFPFPEADQGHARRIRLAAEALDALRKQVLANHPDLTLTKLYNVREAVRSGRALTSAEADIRDRGLVLILDERHHEIDAAVAEAYGWPTGIAEEEAFAALVALNARRAEDEARGMVQWLRPDLVPTTRGPLAKPPESTIALPAVPRARSVKLPFPSKPIPQVAAVLAAPSAGPLDADAIVGRFRRSPRVPRAVREILAALAGVGETSELGQGRYVLRDNRPGRWS